MFQVIELLILVLISFLLGCTQSTVGAKPIKNNIYKIQKDSKDSDLTSVKSSKKIVDVELNEEDFQPKKKKTHITPPLDKNENTRIENSKNKDKVKDKIKKLSKNEDLENNTHMQSKIEGEVNSIKKVDSIVVEQPKTKRKSKYKWIKNAVDLDKIEVLFDAKDNKVKITGQAFFNGNSKEAVRTGASEFSIPLCMEGHIRKTGVAVIRTQYDKCSISKDFYVAGRWYCLDASLNSETTCDNYFIEFFIKKDKFIFSNQWRKSNYKVSTPTKSENSTDKDISVQQSDSSEKDKTTSIEKTSDSSDKNESNADENSTSEVKQNQDSINQNKEDIHNQELPDTHVTHETHETHEEHEDDEVDEIADKGEFVGGFIPVPNMDGEVDYKILDGNEVQSDKEEKVSTINNPAAAAGADVDSDTDEKEVDPDHVEHEPIAVSSLTPIPIPIPIPQVPVESKLNNESHSTPLVVPPKENSADVKVPAIEEKKSDKLTNQVEGKNKDKVSDKVNDKSKDKSKEEKKTNQNSEIDKKIAEAHPLPPISAFNIVGQSVGAANSGSLSKGVNLKLLINELQSKGYNVPFRLARAFRQRYYTNSKTAEFIYNLGLELNKLDSHRKIELGDLSAERGGFVEGHKSHQNGLDADIGFLISSAAKDYYGQSVLGVRGQVLSDFMIENQWSLFRNMISLYNGKVHFFLVHKEVKKAFCRLASKRGDNDKISLETLRRLYVQPGHHDHFHLRMKCPKDNSRCFQQDEIRKTTGC